MKRGPGKKSYWLTVWAMRASAAGVPRAEINATMAKMRRKSIAEIMAWTKESKAQKEGSNA